MNRVDEVHWYIPTPGPATHIARISDEADLAAGVNHIHHVVVQSQDEVDSVAATRAGVIARNWLTEHVGGNSDTWKVLSVRAVCEGIMGVNTRSIPDVRCAHTEFGGSNPMQVSWVLVEGSIGDYAVYCGIGDPDMIERLGNKVSFREACDHFPGGQLVEGLYRE